MGGTMGRRQASKGGAMDKKKAAIVAVTTLVLAGAGTGAVLAGSGDNDKPLRGNALEQATSAALDHVGDGSVVETEVGDDGAAYGVEVRKPDGTVVEVNLDEDFNVTGSERDDDGANEADEVDDDG